MRKTKPPVHPNQLSNSGPPPAETENKSEQKKETVEVTLPSGLKGVIRRMRLKEFNLMTSKTAVRKGRILETLFERIWLETTDLGIYQPPWTSFVKQDGTIVIDWFKVLQGDRNKLLQEARCLIRGPFLDFDVSCRVCQSLIKWRINMNDLAVYDLSEEARDQLTTTGNNEFWRRLPYSGDDVSFKLLLGYDQNNLGSARSRDPDSIFTDIMLARLVHIPGAQNPKERRRFVEEMDAEDVDFIQGEWENTDCDIETNTVVECPECRKIQTVNLPLDEDFFMRSRSRRRRRSGRR